MCLSFFPFSQALCQRKKQSGDSGACLYCANPCTVENAIPHISAALCFQEVLTPENLALVFSPTRFRFAATQSRYPTSHSFAASTESSGIPCNLNRDRYCRLIPTASAKACRSDVDTCVLVGLFRSHSLAAPKFSGIPRRWHKRAFFLSMPKALASWDIPSKVRPISGLTGAAVVVFIYY